MVKKISYKALYVCSSDQMQNQKETHRANEYREKLVQINKTERPETAAADLAWQNGQNHLSTQGPVVYLNELAKALCVSQSI